MGRFSVGSVMLCAVLGVASVVFASGGSDPLATFPDPNRVAENTNPYELARSIIAAEAAAARRMGTLTLFPVVSPAANANTGQSPGTSPSASPTPVPSPVVLRTALELFGPRTFNPAFARDPASRLIRHLTQAPLVRPSSSAAVGYVPVLAEAWTLSKDAKSLEVKLRAGLRWSDGTPLTSSDWVDAATMVYDEPSSFSLRIGESFVWTAKDERTIVLSASEARPLSVFLQTCERYPLPVARYRKWQKMEAPGSLGVAERTAAEASRFMFFDAKPLDLVASGPWKVVDYAGGSRLRLVPNDYFDRANLLSQSWPQGIALDFALIATARDAVDLLEKAQTDVFGASADSLWDLVQAKESNLQRVLGEASNLTLSLAFNTRDGSPFADKEFRAKVRAGIDRDELAVKILAQSAFPAYGLWADLSVKNEAALMSAGRVPSRPAIVSAAPVSVESAASMQQQPSGFNLLYEAGNASREAVARNIAEKLAQKGLKVEPKPLPFDEIVARMAFGGEWEAALISVDESKSPAELSRIWPELLQNGATIPDMFLTVFREQNLVPLVRFRDLALSRTGSGLDPATTAWLINRFQVAKRESM